MTEPSAMSTDSNSALPETILQFGSGRFLRAFAGLFVQRANEAGQEVGRAVVVQSTDSPRARWLNEQGGRFHVAIRGLRDGAIVDEAHEIRCISRALSAADEWEAALAAARQPSLRAVISNTTEAGYAPDPADRESPRSFPARLATLLRARFESGGDGLAIVPCELIEHNASRLREAALAQVGDSSNRFSTWLREACTWHNTLVDRIVTERPPDYGLFPEDRLLAVAEPYALWAVDTLPGEEPPLPRLPEILFTESVQPFFLRKVRILNAAHTALLSMALPRGLTTVLQAVSEPTILAWLKRLLFDEIVPVLEGRVEEPERFAQQTLERFANPFLNHLLADIAKNHAAKRQIRLLPTIEEHKARFGRSPALLEFAASFNP